MKKGIILSIALLSLIFCEWFFFRNLWGTDLLFGDSADGRLTTLITEHWWKFFNGKEKFGELAMLFPVENAIGYSDMFLGFGIIHSGLRLFGLDMYDAYKYTLITVHCIGTLSMFYLCYKKLAMSILWSLFATIAFQFSSAFSIHLGHTQLMALSILPIITILIVDFFKKYTQKANYNIPAYLFIITFVLLMYNSWYVAYFAGIFALVFTIVYLGLVFMNKIKFDFLWTAVKKLWLNSIGYIIFAAILLMPFIYIYLPIIRNSGGYSYSEASIYMPEFADIINVGQSNWLLGKFIEYIGLDMRGYSGEVVIGYSLILLILFIFTLFSGFKFINSQLRLKNVKANYKCQLLVVEAIYISIIVCMLSVIKLSANGVSLWSIFYYTLPGASSVRAVARFVFWLSFPMAVITAYVADKYSSFKSGKKKIVVLCILGLLFASNINKNGVAAGWHKNETLGFTNKVATPPQDVESFFIINASYNLPFNAFESMDAFEIATNYNLKTINAHTGSYPKDWKLNDMDHYNQEVLKWITLNKLENVYAYDKGNNIWIPAHEYFADLQKYKLRDKILFKQSGNADKYIISGFSVPEQEHIWSIGSEAILHLSIDGSFYHDLQLKTTIVPFIGENITSQKIKVYANNILINTWDVTHEGEYTATLPMSLLKEKDIILRFEISNPMSPKELGLSEDDRELGIAFKSLSIL